MKNSSGILVGFISLVLLGTATFFVVKGLKKQKLPQRQPKRRDQNTSGSVLGIADDGSVVEAVESTTTTSTSVVETPIKPINNDLGIGETITTSQIITTTTPVSLGSYRQNDNLPFKKGMYSEYIKDIQRKLGLTADGKFGNNTYNAVVRYQKSKKLVADGIVGKLTWKSLFGKEFPNK